MVGETTIVPVGVAQLGCTVTLAVGAAGRVIVRARLPVIDVAVHPPLSDAAVIVPE